MIKMRTPNLPIRLPNRYNDAKKADPPIILTPSQDKGGEINVTADSAPIVAGIPSTPPASKAATGSF